MTTDETAPESPQVSAPAYTVQAPGDDNTTATPWLTAKMLEKMLRAANHAAHRDKVRGGAYEHEYAAAALATGLVLCEVRRLIPPRAAAPSPPPEAKYREGDWAITRFWAKSEPPVYIHAARWEAEPKEWCYYASYGRDDPISRHLYEHALLPIPPKPDKVQAGYRLRGDVKVADGSEPYIIAFGVNQGRVAYCPADMTAFAGRRWIAELVPAKVVGYNMGEEVSVYSKDSVWYVDRRQGERRAT